eukprot:jgi/Ulvmu1/345/UM001_0350.1
MSKKKHKKGLLPSAIGRTAGTPPNASSNNKGSASKSASGPNVPASKAKAVLAPATAIKKPTAKPRKIDPVTGKKKGTLFSAAPAAPTKPSKGHLRPRQFQHKAARRNGPQAASKRSGPPPPAVGSADGPPDSALHSKEGKVARKKYKRKRASKGTPTPSAADADADGTAHGAAAPAPASAAPATGKSNWERMKSEALQQSDVPAKREPRPPRPLKRRKVSSGTAGAAQVVSSTGVHEGHLVPKSADAAPTEVVALDCEMVGVGNLEVKSKGRDALARVCVVNDHGQVLLDLFVRPKERVTDFRTQFSGIRPKDIAEGSTHEEAMRQVHALVDGRLVVGHAVHHDIKILALQGVVPRTRVRDTALYAPLMSRHPASGKLRSRRLRHVAQLELHVDIQQGEHNPVQDARAALYIYHKHREVWETSVKAGTAKLPGLRAAAKLTKGAKFQKRMRADAAVVTAAAAAAAAGAAADSDDEFAPPDAAAVARMRARLAGELDDGMADV